MGRSNPPILGGLFTQNCRKIPQNQRYTCGPGSAVASRNTGGLNEGGSPSDPAGCAVYRGICRLSIDPAGDRACWFRQYGHFRAGALDDVRARPISFAGRVACEACHPEKREALNKGKHANVGCEACHGPLARHADDPDKMKPVLPDTRVLCPTCHEANSAKPKAFPQVDSKDHSGGEPCKSCHQPHTPKYGQEASK